MPCKVYAPIVEFAHEDQIYVTTPSSRDSCSGNRNFRYKIKSREMLNKFHPILDNTPIAVAETASGIIEFKKMLSAISHGGVV